MSSTSEFQDKIDVLDLIINILKDHEKNLFEIIDKMEFIADSLTLLEKRVSLNPFLETLTHAKNRLIIECKEWRDFKDISLGASLIVFQNKRDSLEIKSTVNNLIISYQIKKDEFPAEKMITDYENPDEIKKWISNELKIPEKRIIEGNIVI